MPTALIAGASRGIGLEFARQYAEEGWRVIGTCRDAGGETRLRAAGADAHRLDVSDVAQIGALAASLAGTSIDVFVHNAGIYGPDTTGVAAPDEHAFEDVMRVNVLAAMRTLAAIGPLVARASGRMAYITSAMGSIAQMSGTYGWLYRVSKAALNAAVRSASAELGAKGVTCVVLHPGWVRTDMGGPGATLDVSTSVTGMRRVITKLQKKDNGRFLDHTGAGIPW